MKTIFAVKGIVVDDKYFYAHMLNIDGREKQQKNSNSNIERMYQERVTVIGLYI
ncbi:MAG: hypothetical protein K5644_10700 [Lachnospiraceae bacterium]|nr:hypothetical protein [Lachnospiraceae bacterium]